MILLRTLSRHNRNNNNDNHNNNNKKSVSNLNTSYSFAISISIHNNGFQNDSEQRPKIQFTKLFSTELLLVMKCGQTEISIDTFISINNNFAQMGFCPFFNIKCRVNFFFFIARKICCQHLNILKLYCRR